MPQGASQAVQFLVFLDALSWGLRSLYPPRSNDAEQSIRAGFLQCFESKATGTQPKTLGKHGSFRGSEQRAGPNLNVFFGRKPFFSDHTTAGKFSDE